MNVGIYKPLCNLVWLLRICEFRRDINSLRRRTDWCGDLCLWNLPPCWLQFPRAIGWAEVFSREQALDFRMSAHGAGHCRAAPGERYQLTIKSPWSRLAVSAVWVTSRPPPTQHNGGAGVLGCLTLTEPNQVQFIQKKGGKLMAFTSYIPI